MPDNVTSWSQKPAQASLAHSVAIWPRKVLPDERRAARFSVAGMVGRPDLAEVMVARFPDGRTAEFVDAVDPLLPKQKKWVINLSTQFGCPVGCPFCDAGGGYRGNLSAEQMLAMLRHVVKHNPVGLAKQCAKLKVHFSRMGEPALNDAVLLTIARLRAELPWPGVWACVATTAPRTRGAWFQKLLHLKERYFSGRFQLQFSINSTDSETRKRLVPIPHWNLSEIAAYGRSFHRPGDRKVVLNFALAQDVPFQSEVISRHFDPQTFAVKLTPINPTETSKQNGFVTVLRSDASAQVDGTVASLRANGFDVVLSMGDPGEDEIGSNCGQAVKWLSRQFTS